MFPQELLASIRVRRRRSAQQSIEAEGAQISRRLRELLDVAKPKQVETFKTRTGNDPGHSSPCQDCNMVHDYTGHGTG